MTDAASNGIDWPSMLEAHRSWLKRVLQSRIGDSHAVEDALQEIALAVVRHHSPERNGGQRFSDAIHPKKDSTEIPGKTGIPEDPELVAPWLYRIAVRQAVNFHRKFNRKSNAKPLADIEVVSPASQPLDWLMGREDQQRFELSMQRLSPAQREILSLKYLEKWSYQQIAEHLGIPVRSVEHRLLQARTELRKHLG